MSCIIFAQLWDISGSNDSKFVYKPLFVILLSEESRHRFIPMN